MAEEKTGEVASPCIGVCKLDDWTGYCVGCSRTGDEIAVWSTCTDVEKQEILRRLTVRKATVYRLKLY